MYMHMHMHESRFKYHQIILNHLLLTVSVTPLQVEFLATAVDPTQNTLQRSMS